MNDPNTFDRLCDEIIAADFRRWPEMATCAGVHEYDGQVTDHSPAALRESIRERAGYVRRLEEMGCEGLDPDRALDHALVLATLKGGLVADEQVRIESRTPDNILEGFCWSVLSIVRRSFAPAEHRMRSIISRLEQFPKVAHDVRQRLTEPSAIPIAIALNSVKDSLSFFRNTLPGALPEVADGALRSRLGDAARAVAEEYERLAAWLEEIKPKAAAPYAIGSEVFDEGIRTAELTDLSLSELLSAGERELARLSEEFAETAAQVNPSKKPAEVHEELTKDHPPGPELLDFVRSMLEDLRGFCVSRDLLTFPSENRCAVEPTPEFFRELTFASMDSPGPFEQVAREAYYNVTTPLPEWDAEQTEQHMRAYNRWALTSTSIHEAYPGHYTQFLWQDRWPSRARKLYGSYSGVEGWAHYAEHLMVEQGYLDGDARFKLGQIQEALLRACRHVVGIGLHTREMRFEDGVEVFVKKGYLEPLNAERETRRGTVDPFYCNYTFGKLMLLKLRDDYRAKFPGKSLKEFHDAFLAEGYPPIPLVRKKLLGEVGRVL